MKLGGNEIAALRLGSADVAAAYLGAAQVWPSGFRLAGALLSTSALSGVLSVGRPLAGDLAAASALAGGLAVDRQLAGALATHSVMTGDLSVYDEVLLAGDLAALSAMSGAVSVSRALSGAASSLSAMSGAASVQRVLAGAAAALSALSGSIWVQRALAGAISSSATLAGALTVTSSAKEINQKGYGHIYDSGETADLSMSYANVDGGSAPAAGDLVCWIFLGGDSSASPVVNITGAGWAQGSAYVNTLLGATIVAKVVSAGDLSSPPLVIDDPNSGSIGFWVAYSVSGTISSLSVSTVNAHYSSGAAPTNQTCNSTSLNDPSVAVTIGAGGGTDGTPSLAISGAAADITFDSAADQWLGGSDETRFMVNKTIGGANITFSKGDDGSANHMASGFVTVDFA